MSKPQTTPEPAAGSAAAPQRWQRRALLFVFLLCLFSPWLLYADNEDWLPKFSKFMCLALFAVSVDLVWGYTGLLSLGQGLYFGLGAYAIGFCLRLQRAHLFPDRELGTVAGVPDFMTRGKLTEIPWFLAPLIDLRVGLAVALILPPLVAYLFGLITFRLRIKGVYFSLITQMWVLTVLNFVASQSAYTGGVEGLTPLQNPDGTTVVFGYELTDGNRFFMATGVLAVCFVGCVLLVQSKFGKVLTAIRDNEFRVLALGYNTAMYKTFVYTLAGFLAGIAGAMFTVIQGNVGPKQVFSVEFSIVVVILVAVGGRGTLYGAVIGALLVNIGEEHINRINVVKEHWRFVLGALFIVTVVFLPNGLVGGFQSLMKFIRRRRGDSGPLVLGSEAQETPAPARANIAPLAVPPILGIQTATEKGT